MGGTVDGYLTALADVDQRFGVDPSGTTRVHVHRSRAPLARLTRLRTRLREAAHRCTAALPRMLRPGRTYIDL